MMSSSAIYDGVVMHQRLRPKRHRLRYQVFCLLLDLDELPALDRRVALFGFNRPAPISFFNRDPGPTTDGPLPDARQRQGQQVGELVAFTQVLLRRCAKLRDKRWSGADRTSLATWAKTAESYRDMVYDELIGRLPEPTMPPQSKPTSSAPKPVAPASG